MHAAGQKFESLFAPVIICVGMQGFGRNRNSLQSSAVNRREMSRERRASLLGRKRTSKLLER